MKPSIKPVIAALLAGASLCVNARTLTIGIDLSASNPLLSSETFAHEAAKHATQAILALKDGDVVRVRTFGARSDARNVLDSAVTLGRRMRARKVADALGAYLRALPRNGEKGQSSTNLLAWLEFGSGYRCEDGGEILVITDGVETSTLVSGRALLLGKASLPPPKIALAGCTLTFYGLGTGLPAQQVMILRDQWTHWAERAGARFTPIIP